MIQRPDINHVEAEYTNKIRENLEWQNNSEGFWIFLIPDSLLSIWHYILRKEIWLIRSLPNGSPTFNFIAI